MFERSFVGLLLICALNGRNQTMRLFLDHSEKVGATLHRFLTCPFTFSNMLGVSIEALNQREVNKVNVGVLVLIIISTPLKSNGG